MFYFSGQDGMFPGKIMIFGNTVFGFIFLVIFFGIHHQTAGFKESEKRTRLDDDHALSAQSPFAVWVPGPVGSWKSTANAVEGLDSSMKTLQNAVKTCENWRFGKTKWALRGAKKFWDNIVSYNNHLYIEDDNNIEHFVLSNEIPS